MDERERSIIAAHEVGHAICGKVHGDKRKVEEISLFAHGEALGVTVSSQEDNDLPSETDLRARLIALMGGRAAEEILFHEVTGGASNDFEAANRIATSMVLKWGMGRDPEATDGGISGRGQLSFLVPIGGRSLPSEIQAAATRAIREILDESYAEASRTLVAHLGTLRRLAAYLVEHERVDGGTFDELFDGRRLVPNADDEWRAATSRPREWADVVDLAGRRIHQGGVMPVPAIPAEVPAAASVPTPAGAAAAATVALDSSTVDEPTFAAATTLVGDASQPIAAVGELVSGDTSSTDLDAGGGATPPPVPLPLVPVRHRRTRRSTSRRVRSVASSVLLRTERWLRPSELDTDRT